MKNTMQRLYLVVIHVNKENTIKYGYETETRSHSEGQLIIA